MNLTQSTQRSQRLADLNGLSAKIIAAAIDVHRELGPGLLESVYERCLVIRLAEMGLHVQTQVPVRITFHGHAVSGDGLRLDLLVEDAIVVELKSIETVLPVHKKILLTYLRLSHKPLGLLINFSVVLLKDGIERIINLPSESSVISV